MGTQRIDRHDAGCDLASRKGPGYCAWRACGRRLPSHRKRFCSDHCGRLWYSNHRWHDAREAAKERAGYACERCGAAPLEGLEVHHQEPINPAEGYGRPSCAHHQTNLTVLCPTCHREDHSFRREVERLLVWADGQVSRQLVLPGVG
mgnify:CR=1 FL=1